MSKGKGENVQRANGWTRSCSSISLNCSKPLQSSVLSELTDQGFMLLSWEFHSKLACNICSCLLMCCNVCFLLINMLLNLFKNLCRYDFVI